MKAVIYARYSSDTQREESIEGQIRECTEYAEREGITILRSYIDRALSARTADRPDFQRMIADSEKQLFDAVLVWKLDRFSRDRYDSAHYKHILKKNGVKVISAKEAISDGPEGIILESMLEGMNEYYSAELSVKIRRGQKENAMKCKNNGGRTPLGFFVNKETGKLDIDPLGVSTVREIFERYANGEMMQDIVNSLNGRGLRTRRGKPFRVAALSQMMKNRAYIGEYRYRDTVVPGGLPAIIDNELFERVQRRMEANKRAPARTKATEEYLLSGKLFCGSCGKLMVGESGRARNGTVHYYYKCSGAKRHEGCTRHKAIRKHPIERAVVYYTVSKVLQDDVIRRIADAILEIQESEDTTIPALEAQLRDCERGIENMINAIQAGVLTSSTKERLDALEQRRDELKTAIAQAKLERPKFTREQINQWISRFKYGNIDDKEYQKEIIDIFLNSVYVYDDRLVLTYNYRDGTQTLTLQEIEAAFGSDLTQLSPPKKNGNFDEIAVLFVVREIALCYNALKEVVNMAGTLDSYKALVKRVFLLLKEQGFAFKKDGFNFRLIDESSFPKVAFVVNFQRSAFYTKDSISFTINLGVLVEYSNKPIPPNLKEYECPIRNRPASFSEKYNCDKWWDITEKTDIEALYQEIQALTLESIIPFFEKYKTTK